jgi:hypothetical protein
LFIDIVTITVSVSDKELVSVVTSSPGVNVGILSLIKDSILSDQ